MNYISKLSLDKEDKDVLDESNADSPKENDFETFSTQKQVRIKKCKKIKYDKILSLETELKLLIEELKKSANDINLLIKRNELITQIRLGLLTIYSDLQSLTRGQKNKLNKISKANDLALNQDLKEIFIAEFWIGNIDSVKLLYPHIENQITFEFLSNNIFQPLIFQTPKSQEHESKLRMVFDFLYQESSQYRYQFITNNKCILYKADNEKVYKSLLIRTCQQENLFAFKLLLVQGMNPNDIGILVNDVQIPVLFCIANIKKEGVRHAFFQEALKFGAHYTISNKLKELIN
jgi:hypothetical protein